MFVQYFDCHDYVHWQFVFRCFGLPTKRRKSKYMNQTIHFTGVVSDDCLHFKLLLTWLRMCLTWKRTRLHVPFIRLNRGGKKRKFCIRQQLTTTQKQKNGAQACLICAMNFLKH